MRALTVRQPWAWAIIHGGKDIENRTWANKYVTGTIAIHAGSRLDSLGYSPRGTKKPRPEEIVHSAVIGVVDIVAVVKQSRSKWFSGPLGWVLRNPRQLRKPIHCRGRLGLWRIPSRLQAQIKRGLR